VTLGRCKAVAALMLLAALLVPRRSTAVAIASGLLLASLALTGHSVMQEGWLGIAHRFNDAIHVLTAGACWAGSSRCL